jgi:hypothetical protein
MSYVKLDNSGRKGECTYLKDKINGLQETERTRISGNFARAQINLGTITNLHIGNVKRRVICWQIRTILLVGGGSIPVSF